MANDNEVLKQLVAERLENESADNLIGLGTVFGLDRDSLEAASPIQKVQLLLENIPLEQLADILEIKGGTAPAPAPAIDLPPPPPESEILAHAEEEAPPDVVLPEPEPTEEEPLPAVEEPVYPVPEEATFADDLLPPEPAPAEEQPYEAAPVAEEPLPVEMEAPPAPPVEAEAPPAPPAEEPAEVTDMEALAAEMLAAGDLSEEELRALKAEAGVKEEESRQPEDEVDVLQQLRSVRKGTVRQREKERYAKRKREAAAKAPEAPAPDKAAQFRLWLFRGMMVVFIGLVAMRSTVILDLPDKISNLKLLIQIKVTGDVPETAVARIPPVTPPTPDGPVTTPGPKPVAPPPPLPLAGPELTRAFVERELRAGDLKGTIDFASRSLGVPAEQVRQQVYESAAAAQQDVDRGVAQLLAQDLGGAEATLRKTSQAAGPAQARATYLLGHVLRLQGRLDEADQTLQQAVAQSPQDPAPLLELAEIQRARGNLDGAADFARRAISVKPDHVDSHFELAEVLKDKGQLPEAKAAYQELLTKDPKQSYAHFSIGLIDFKSGDHKAAAESFRKAVETNHAWRFADIGQAYNNLASCLDNLGKPDEAMKMYEMAAKARPDDDVIQYNLGRAYQRYEYPEKAIRPLERAVDLMQLKEQREVGDLYLRAVVNLAEVYMRVHDFRLAAQRYDEALRLAADKPETEAQLREKLARALEAKRQAEHFSVYYGTPTVAAGGELTEEEPKP